MGFGLASCRGLSCEQVEVTMKYWIVVNELSADPGCVDCAFLKGQFQSMCIVSGQ